MPAGAKPQTADEIKAEYERREFDLRTWYEQQAADLYGDYLRRLQKLREDRAAELAEIEERGSNGETTEVHES